MNNYCYDQDNVYTTTIPVQIDYRSGDHFPPPPNATNIAPPTEQLPDNKAYRFIDDKWVIVDDYRRVKFWCKENRKAVELSIGESPDETITDIEPRPEQVWNDDRWVYPPAPIHVPHAISPRQARLVLLAADLLVTVESAIAEMPSPDGDAARIEWEYATEIRRDSALLDALAPRLGLTAEQIDQMFIRAAQL